MNNESVRMKDHEDINLSYSVLCSSCHSGVKTIEKSTGKGTVKISEKQDISGFIE